MKKVIFSRKPANLNEINNPIFQECTAAPYSIMETIRLSTAMYDKLASDLLADCDFLTGKGGADENGKAKCILVEAPSRRSLLINPEGYSYARYVAFA